MQQQVRKITNIMKWILGSLAIIICSVAFIATLPYSLFTNVYDFPAPKPFSGKTWYNPYAGLSFDDINHWKKSNFHGHTKAWQGITDGHSDHAIYDSVYRALGYHSIGISNYQFIDTTFNKSTGYVPCYEHGYNVWKRHHVCIGAQSITWLDFLFGQSIHHKQTMLDHLRPTMDVLAIAHPRFRGSFDAEDFLKLSGYDCIEVLNHYRISDEQWDSALSAGYPAWIVGDDDTHNASAEGETGVCWTMIHAPGNAKRTELTTSLKQGRAFGMTGKRGIVEIYPTRYEIIGDTVLHISLSDTARSIELIGQGGNIIGRDTLAREVNHRLQSSVNYVRAKIHGDSSIMWMNPVMRWDGKQRTKPIINVTKTIAYRSTWWIGYTLIIIVIAKRFRKRKK